MFLQHLTSELRNAPAIDHGLKEAEEAVKSIPSILSIEDLETLAELRTKQYGFEMIRGSINITSLEKAFFQAKHYRTGALELEEDFV